MGLIRTASCMCGGLEIRCQGDPSTVSVCHCHACKKRTGGAFSWNALWSEEATESTGQAATYTRLSDDGGEVTYCFCPTCGVTVYYHIGAMPGRVSVCAGAFAEDAFPAPAVSVYESRRPDWLVLETEPLTRID